MRFGLPETSKVSARAFGARSMAEKQKDDAAKILFDADGDTQKMLVNVDPCVK